MALPECDVCARRAGDAVCGICHRRRWCVRRVSSRRAIDRGADHVQSQSTECQERDRAPHEWNCSPTTGPVLALPWAAEQLDEVVEAACAPLLQWEDLVLTADAHDEHLDAAHLPSAVAFRGSSPLCPMRPRSPTRARTEHIARLPAVFRCHERLLAARTPHHPFRAPIVALSRLLLLHTLPRQAPAFAPRLAAVVAAMSVRYRHPLAAAQLLARPAQLSPGEYAAAIYALLTALSRPCEDVGALQRWAALYTAWDRLWDYETEDA
jgi:hypothetical protein